MNAAPEVWNEFKAAADEEGVSAAAKLGELVRATVGGKAKKPDPKLMTEICPTCGRPLKDVD